MACIITSFDRFKSRIRRVHKLSSDFRRARCLPIPDPLCGLISEAWVSTLTVEGVPMKGRVEDRARHWDCLENTGGVNRHCANPHTPDILRDMPITIPAAPRTPNADSAKG